MRKIMIDGVKLTQNNSDIFGDFAVVYAFPGSNIAGLWVDDEGTPVALLAADAIAAKHKAALEALGYDGLKIISAHGFVNDAILLNLKSGDIYGMGPRDEVRDTAARMMNGGAF